MQRIIATNIKTAVQQITPLLEDTSKDAPKVIYFDGWYGVGASAVLRAISKRPPLSLWEKFDKIIHIDCSRWKSRRALQRAITDELNLTQQVAADFERQDEEDDLSGVDQASRKEIEGISRVIARSLVPHRCLVVFHNGGRLRINSDIYESAYDSHLIVDAYGAAANWTALLEEEAREISLYTHELGLGVTPEIATKCCLYYLSLKYRDDDVLSYNWAIHASSYWVCDGIVGEGEDNLAWELARAMQQHIILEDYTPVEGRYSSYMNRPPKFVSKLEFAPKHWISITNSYFKEVPPGTTSIFFAPKKSDPLVSLPSDKFLKADQFRVLKLCLCTFSFSSPPFHCCLNLRFLGLDRCMDVKQLGGKGEEEGETGALAVEIFQRLWVLHVCRTDWELAFPLETQEQVTATDVREIHINKGRIWRTNLAWRRLSNLRRLRIVEPSSSWETGRKEEFMDMVKLELLDLSGNSTIQVLPSLSGATGLKTLVLDGCVGLEHIGSQGLPPSLESFSLNAGADEDHKKTAEISCISLVGCARLADFKLSGSLPKLEELDLSHTAVKFLDLKEVVQVGNIQRVLFMGCERLRSISWPQTRMPHLRLVCIDTRAGGEVTAKPWSRDSLTESQGDRGGYHRAFLGLADLRLLQSMVSLWKTNRCNKVNLCWSAAATASASKGTVQFAACSPLPKSSAYHDISIEQITAKIDGSSSSSLTQFSPLDVHMEISEGISDITNEVSTEARSVIGEVMNGIQSLHVHDSSSITTVAPEHIVMFPKEHEEIMNGLRWCRVERCPKLDKVFATNHDDYSFSDLETFWAAHLLRARSIWSRRARQNSIDWTCFTDLRAVHLHCCPRLRYVAALSSNNTFSYRLETLHIVCCGELRQVFPMEQELAEETRVSEQGTLRFPKLKDLYLHELPSLQLICEAKMFAPKLDTIYVRGCWSLRHLPTTDDRRCKDGRPVAVDCEKDWWDKLEWDGMESGHHPSLFQPRHSKYYKKRHLRSTVLR
ncbi:unnamed protein product [Urochloa decumbens]|uniref:Disease resistance protein At4g27190-like leucine-rich repeats domain-containing protein n=1 Tax=Urochloa decumbens TaxID=240449 RepID=A0ABC9BR55_9POAL